MPQTTAYSTPSNSRLVHVLSDLLETDKEIPHQRFIAKLSKLIDFSSAIELSTSLGGSMKFQTTASKTASKTTLSGTTKPKTTIDETLLSNARNVLMSTHEKMLAFITHSFAITNRYDHPFYLPLPTDDHFSHADGGISAYLRFYSLHQSEMELQTARLLTKIRQCLSAHSPALAHLATMDATLNTIMASYSRTVFAFIPKLLTKRWKILYSTQHSTQQIPELPVTAEKAAAANQFIVEMRGVLLAELDIRLKPALGLTESLISASQTIEEENTPS